MDISALQGKVTARINQFEAEAQKTTSSAPTTPARSDQLRNIQQENTRGDYWSADQKAKRMRRLRIALRDEDMTRYLADEKWQTKCEKR